MKNKELFSLENTVAARLLDTCEYPWQLLDMIKEYILRIGGSLPKDRFYEPIKNVWIAKNARLAKTAAIAGPTIICEGAEIRHGAFLRGGVIIGRECVVGNSTEVKNSIFFDGAQAPHYNYVGDSILGYRSHLGAGAVTSNLKSDKSEVTVTKNGEKIHTGRKKFGAALGDMVEVGCGSVLCPGTVVAKNSTVYPLCRVRGYIPENSIFKSEGVVLEKENREVM
ncbi:MAG: UDP-N-acetylglucosamine pyrophosphorylase [Clostridia bacterium]|nr:UDP-N-acetylglucosamine pyrophosphorylase [Clostridia bacterium]